MNETLFSSFFSQFIYIFISVLAFLILKIYVSRPLNLIRTWNQIDLCFASLNRLNSLTLHNAILAISATLMVRAENFKCQFQI